MSSARPPRSRPAARMALAGAIAVGLLAASGPASGQGNLELGPFRILTNLDLSGEYNDNILLSPRDETSDFIWTISPGVTVELPGRQSALRLGYRADVLRYTDNDALDTIDHTVQLEGRMNLARGLTLTAKDEFKYTRNFAGFPVPELTDKVDRFENQLGAGAEYQLPGRFAVALDYTFIWLDYDAGPLFDELDRSDHTVALTVLYRIMPKTSILGEYDYQVILYDVPSVARDRDSEAHFFKVGAKGDLTAKTSVALKVGVEFKDYENPARPDFDGLVVEGEIVWKYRDPSQLRIYGGRANVESTFQENNFFVANYGGVELRHYVTPTVIGTVRGLVGTNDYPTVTTVGTETKKRADTFYELLAGVRWQARRWLALELNYQYLARESNFEDFDYRNSRIIGQVRLTY